MLLPTFSLRLRPWFRGLAIGGLLLCLLPLAQPVQAQRPDLVVDSLALSADTIRYDSARLANFLLTYRLANRDTTAAVRFGADPVTVWLGFRDSNSIVPRGTPIDTLDVGQLNPGADTTLTVTVRQLPSQDAKPGENVIVIWPTGRVVADPTDSIPVSVYLVQAQTLAQASPLPAAALAPNPGPSYFELANLGWQPQHVHLLDLQGRTLQTWAPPHTTNPHARYTVQAPPGTYLVLMQGANRLAWARWVNRP